MRGGASPAAIIASILLPPLGIFLARGLGTPFWVGMLLTLIGWIPGIVFALVVVLQPGFLARA